MYGSLLKIQELMEQNSPVERRISAFMLDNAARLPGMPIADVAKACETSKSSVVRLCKQIGFKGYKDFLNALSADLAVSALSSAPDDQTDIHPDHTVAEICQIVTQKSIRSLENTLNLLDMGQMEQAVDAIASAQRVDFYGVGSSGIIAQDAELKFRRIGLTTFASLDSHCQLISAVTLKPKDVAVVFSYYGETRDLMDTVGIARENGATILLVTKYGHSTLSDQADIVLNVASVETIARSGAMASRMVMLQVVDMLFTAVTSRKYDQVRDVLQRTAWAMQRKRT
jgi:DNA-binding MurR/RpiR family transcriptional regulator